MKLKKLLALILALMMAVCVFAACSDDTDTSKDEDDEKQEEKATKDNDKKVVESTVSDEDAVEDVVEKFATLYFSGDESALDYVDENAEDYDELVDGMAAIVEVRSSLDELSDGMMNETGIPEEYSEEMTALAENFVHDIFSYIDITVLDSEVNGDTATVRCEISSPDFTQDFDTLLSNTDMEAIIFENYTEEEIMEIGNSGEEAQAEFMIEIMEIMIDEMVSAIGDSVVTDELEFKLEKINGEWLIVK